MNEYLNDPFAIRVLEFESPRIIREMFFKFESGYIVEFAKFKQLVMEAGLDRHWANMEMKTKRDVSTDIYKEFREKDEEVLLIILCCVLSVGSSLALVIFIIELILNF